MGWCKHILLITGALVLLGSCCYKKDCVVDVPEEIQVFFNHNPANGGFTGKEINDMVMVLKDPSTGDTIDLISVREISGGFAPADTIHGFNEIQLNGRNKTAKGADIVIRSRDGSFADTLFNIHFDYHWTEFTCGNCPFTDNTEQIPFITARGVTHRGKLVTERAFPVMISKK